MPSSRRRARRSRRTRGAFARWPSTRPAVWTSYAQARAANAHAFTSTRGFAAHDVIAGAGRLRRVAVHVAAGSGDPSYPGVRALARALPPSVITHFSSGCHTSPFFDSQEPPSLAFLTTHLSREIT